MKEQKIWNKGMNLDILNIYIFYSIWYW
jgi:hypothetical protein